MGEWWALFGACQIVEGDLYLTALGDGAPEGGEANSSAQQPPGPLTCA